MLMAGSEKLKRQLLTTARQRGAGGRDGALWPLVQAVNGMQVPTSLMRDVLANINEDGVIGDNASEQVTARLGQCWHLHSARMSWMVAAGYLGRLME